MLSSTKRRILNIISLSLAILALGTGLVMRYSTPDPGFEMVDLGDVKELVVERDITVFTNPYSQADPN